MIQVCLLFAGTLFPAFALLACTLYIYKKYS